MAQTIFTESGEILGWGVDVFHQQIALLCERMSLLIHMGTYGVPICWFWRHKDPPAPKEAILRVDVQPYPLRGQRHLPAFLWHIQKNEGSDLVNGVPTPWACLLTFGTHGVFLVGEEGLSVDPWGKNSVPVPQELKGLFPGPGKNPKTRVSYVTPSGRVLVATEEWKKGHVSLFEVLKGKVTKHADIPAGLHSLHPMGLGVIIENSKDLDPFGANRAGVRLLVSGKELVAKTWARFGEYRSSSLCTRIEDTWGRLWEFRVKSPTPENQATIPDLHLGHPVYGEIDLREL